MDKRKNDDGELPDDGPLEMLRDSQGKIYVIDKERGRVHLVKDQGASDQIYIDEKGNKYIIGDDGKIYPIYPEKKRKRLSKHWIGFAGAIIAAIIGLLPIGPGGSTISCSFLSICIISTPPPNPMPTVTIDANGTRIAIEQTLTAIAAIQTAIASPPTFTPTAIPPTLTSDPGNTSSVGSTPMVSSCPQYAGEGKGITWSASIDIPAGEVAFIDTWGFDDMTGNGFFIVINGPYSGNHIIRDGAICYGIPTSANYSVIKKERCELVAIHPSCRQIILPGESVTSPCVCA